MSAPLTLQRLILDRPAALQPLYHRRRGRGPALPVAEQGALRIPAGATVSFDTYFNAFYEHQWRAWTALEGLVLAAQIEGPAQLRVYRRAPDTPDILLRELGPAELAAPLRLALPSAGPQPRAGGRLFLEITALDGDVRLRKASWQTADTPQAAVGLVPVFCTFNRETALAALLASLAAEPAVLAAVPQLVVVNQGRPGLRAHPAFAALPAALTRRLLVIEQGNFGGAGGFTRGLLAALEQPGATHALLMDDDVTVEPDSLLRAAAFFAIARPGLALGGQMLDQLRPTRLFEAGATIDPRSWYLRPLHPDTPLDRRPGLDRFLDLAPMHYNGWWFFGLPLAMLRQAGLPLPCFIRGDDVEYGRRLHDMGLHTVSLPGVAVWHEPFYARLGGWQLYYETRNMLVMAALHFPRGRAGLAWLMLKRLLTYLLTFRYYGAALVLQAIEDYLRGPALFETPPAALHASLDRHRLAHPPETAAPERVVPPAPIPRDPRHPVQLRPWLLWALLRHGCRATQPAAAPRRIALPDLIWFRVARLDHVVVETWWDRRWTVLRRSRPAFRGLLRRGLPLLGRLYAEGPKMTAEWRQAFPRLTGMAFWRSYLGLGPPVLPAAVVPPVATVTPRPAAAVPQPSTIDG